MSSVVILGDSSGTITLSAPSVAGSNTLTLPASTGTVARQEDVIGVNQTWQNVSASRVAGTTYTNSTGKPIQLAIQAGSSAATLTVGGVSFPFNATVSFSMIYVIVPNATTYVYTSAGAATVWNELR